MASRSGCGEWYHNKCMNIQVKVFFEIKSTSCNGNVFLQKIDYMKMKIRDLFVEELCGDIRHLQKLDCGNIFLAQSQKFDFLVKLINNSVFKTIGITRNKC